MTLSRRALILIIPVLLLIYAAAALTVYGVLNARIGALEKSRLDLAATRLASEYSAYSTFAESYLLSLTGNYAFRDLVEARDDVYMNVALGASIEANIRSFEQHLSDKLSFLVVQKQPVVTEIYYFELSEDPFAEISPLQRASYQRAIAGQTFRAIEYLESEQHTGMIVVSRAIDPVTLKDPIVSQINASILAQFAIEPTLFLQARERIINEYGATVTVTSAPPPQTTDLMSQIQLGPTHTLSISVPPTYLNNILISTQLALAGIAAAFFIASALLLYRLVRRHITDPIEHLENELSDVFQNQKNDIYLSHTKNDEIGRLGQTFRTMYSALAASYSRTKELAERDTLTSLHNLAYFNDAAQSALREAAQRGHRMAILYIDLDNFKFVNDRFGHDTGDALLKAFASRLSRIVRDNDLIADVSHYEATPGRIAGDEFLVMITRYQDKKTPKHIAERIAALFKSGFTFEQGTFPVSASIGIAVYPEDGQHLTQLISNADNAMYQAKNNGKNNVAFYSKALATSMRRRMDIENALKSASLDDEFRLVFMPVVRAHDFSVAGYEALLRWHSPMLGEILPDEFIPIAEATGLFADIDHWVCYQSFRHYPSLNRLHSSPVFLSINLSSAQLNLDSIRAHLTSLAADHEIEPSNIQLEMTETLNVDVTEKAKTLLYGLREDGFRLAIDDFGTGYTALLQLVEYPAHSVKFDKFFIERAMQPPNSDMLAPLIELCHSQGLKVTAEGVETIEIAEQLRAAGCDFLQGYYFGEPQSIEILMDADALYD